MSASGLPERVRAGVVCVRKLEGRGGLLLLCVRLRDPSSGIARLFPPGGRVEPGESAREAAERETFEETGYRVEARAQPERIARYPYTWDGVTRAVTTHLFRADLLGDPEAPAPVADADYNQGAVWLPLDALDRELGFLPEILEAVRALITA